MIRRTCHIKNGWTFKFYPVEEKEILNYFLNLNMMKGGLKEYGQ